MEELVNIYPESQYNLNNQNKGQYLDSDTVEVVGTNLQEGADLVGAGLHLVDNGYEHNPVEPGDKFHVEYSVLNAGSGDAPFYANNFYIVKKDFLNDHNQITDKDIDYHNVYGLLGDHDSFSKTSKCLPNKSAGPSI